MIPIFQDMQMGRNILSPYKAKKVTWKQRPHSLFKVQQYLQDIINSSLGFKKISVWHSKMSEIQQTDLY